MNEMLLFWKSWLELIPAFLMSQPIIYFVGLSVGAFILGLISRMLRINN